VVLHQGRARLPERQRYDGYPQIDNGVGLVRDFLTEFAREEKAECKALLSFREKEKEAKKAG
jgi:hypothetical protein